jgi:hypothetical protein
MLGRRPADMRMASRTGVFPLRPHNGGGVAARRSSNGYPALRTQPPGSLGGPKERGRLVAEFPRRFVRRRGAATSQPSVAWRCTAGVAFRAGVPLVAAARWTDERQGTSLAARFDEVVVTIRAQGWCSWRPPGVRPACPVARTVPCQVRAKGFSHYNLRQFEVRHGLSQRVLTRTFRSAGSQTAARADGVGR